MKRTQLVSKGTLDKLFKTADEARGRRDFQTCAEILERASRLDPGNANITLNLGHAHGLCFDYASAEACFERAIRMSTNKTDALSAAGLRAQDFGNHQMAEHYFQRSVQRNNASPDSMVKLAEIRERLNRSDDANNLLDQALRTAPGFPPALLVRARLQRQTGQLEEAEKLLREIPPSIEYEMRARVYYELGGILDRKGRFDEAMQAFVGAKSILRPTASRFIAERQVTRARLGELRDTLDLEQLRKWHDSKQNLEPLHRVALLCGHPRSGTTLLEQVLDSHSEVISAEETDIFHNHAYLPLMRDMPENVSIQSVLESTKDDTLLKSRNDYFRLIQAFLGQEIGDRLLIDKNPSLTYLIIPFLRIFPEAKFLVALRDPRDVCLSCFMQPFVPVGQTSSAYLSLQSTTDEYVELMEMYCSITEHLESLRLEVRYEDLVEDLESASKRVLEFLGLRWDTRVLRFDEHARQKLVRSPTYADVKTPVFKRAVGRWRNYEKYIEPYVVKLEPFMRKLH